MRITFPSFFLSAILLGSSPGCGQQPPSPVARIAQRSVPLASGAPQGAGRPFFDASGRLDWNAAAGPAVCPPEARETQRVTRLLAPRVDEVLCAREAPGGIPVTEGFLAGAGAAGGLAWKRPLGFHSGSLVLDQRVAGAGPAGVVLNDLTVLAPATGEVLLAPATHSVGSEPRPVPDWDVPGSAAYLPSRKAFLIFEADVTLAHRSGGLYLLDPRTKKKELVREVSATLTGAYWRVEEMAAGPAGTGERVFLAQKLAYRGPAGVSFALFDLRSRKLLFEERFGEGHYCRDPHLALGPDGNVGFSYVDETDGKVVLVHYRVTPPRS